MRSVNAHELLAARDAAIEGMREQIADRDAEIKRLRIERQNLKEAVEDALAYAEMAKERYEEAYRVLKGGEDA